MKLVLPGQISSLDAWKKRGFNGDRGGNDKELVFQKIIAQEPPGPPLAGGPHQRVAEAIFRYEVFPPHLIRGVIERAPVDVGDTVGIEYQLGAGARLFFAARVIDRFDQKSGDLWRTGFTYRTLEGHPEIGEEIFSVEKNITTGSLCAKLESWSRPGLWVTSIAAPVLRIVQRRASEAALDHLMLRAKR